MVLAALALAGCQTMTLEEAKAACTQKGGLLVILYTQKVNRDYTLGPAVAHPGNCVSPDKFHQPAAPAQNPPSDVH